MVDDNTGRQFYHGTSELAALCIATEGFWLQESSRAFGQNMLGYGIYVTANLEVAAAFGSYIFRVLLVPGTRILWLDEHYDRHVIASLAREFGKEILAFDFAAAIPTNKHLRRVELIALCNYLWAQFDRLDLPALPQLSTWRRLLVQYGYEALGCPENYAGVVVFNPSRVITDGLFHRGDGSQGLRLVAPAELARHASRAMVEIANRAWVGPLDPYSAQSMQFARGLIQRALRCLRSFCARHGLPTDQGDIAAALDAKTAAGPSIIYRSP